MRGPCVLETDASCYFPLRTSTSARRRSPPAKPTPGPVPSFTRLARSNFLFDRSQTPHMRADELCRHFGLSASAGGAKSTAIMKLLNSGQADPHWTLTSRMGDNPVAWLIQVDGFIVDARRASREIQEEAFRRGMIPYLP